MKPTDAVAEMTVESALNELRERWPGCSAEVVRFSAMGFYKEPESWVEIAIITTDYKIHGQRFKGDTVKDAIQAVRAWKERQ